MSSGFRFSESSTGSIGMFRYGDFLGRPELAKPAAAGTEFGDCSDLGFIGEGPPKSPNDAAPADGRIGLSVVMETVIDLDKRSVTSSW